VESGGVVLADVTGAVERPQPAFRSISVDGTEARHLPCGSCRCNDQSRQLDRGIDEYLGIAVPVTQDVAE
jgi:hypothetical protein